MKTNTEFAMFLAGLVVMGTAGVEQAIAGLRHWFHGSVLVCRTYQWFLSGVGLIAS